MGLEEFSTYNPNSLPAWGCLVPVLPIFHICLLLHAGFALLSAGFLLLSAGFALLYKREKEKMIEILGKSSPSCFLKHAKVCMCNTLQGQFVL